MILLTSRDPIRDKEACSLVRDLQLALTVPRRHLSENRISVVRGGWLIGELTFGPSDCHGGIAQVGSWRSERVVRLSPNSTSRNATGSS